MSFSKIWTIFRKELKDTLRDRRTIIFTFTVPIIAIPLLMFGIFKLMAGQEQKISDQAQEVVVSGWQNLPESLANRFEADTTLTFISAEEYGEADEDSLRAILERGDFASLLVVPPRFEDGLNAESQVELEVYYDRAEEVSRTAMAKLRDVLSPYKEELVTSRLRRRELPDDLTEPFVISSYNVATAQKFAAKGLGGLLPYFIIISCLLGAMAAAIDLGAGEKERGTIETLLVAPASRGEFVLGKYFTLCLMSTIAGLLSLVSMAGFFRYFASDQGMGKLAELANVQIEISTVILVLAVILPLAGVFSAILLSLSIFAKSAKEAQSYVGMVNFLVILPAMISLLPGVELNHKMALIPIVNISLVIKEGLAGSLEWQFVATTFVSTLVFAGLALLFCKKWFEREQVLFRM